MLDAIIRWSLHNRLVVILGAIGFVGLGIVSLHNPAIDAFPDTTPVQVQINTVAPCPGGGSRAAHDASRAIAGRPTRT